MATSVPLNPVRSNKDGNLIEFSSVISTIDDRGRRPWLDIDTTPQTPTPPPIMKSTGRAISEILRLKTNLLG